MSIIGLSYRDRNYRAYELGKAADKAFRDECQRLGLREKTALVAPLLAIGAAVRRRAAERGADVGAGEASHAMSIT